MNLRLLILFLSCLVIIPAHATHQEFYAHKSISDPLLIVVLMVKNEATVMRDTLETYLHIINERSDAQGAFFIFDTGSTDDTIAITQNYFQEKNVQNAVIQQEPFVDFEVSRNRALDCAQEAFPGATFMLMPDAEWYMHNPEALLEFCKTHKNDLFHSAYLVRIMSTHLDFYTARLLRCRSGVRFVGKVHEAVYHSNKKVTPDTCYFEWRPREAGIEKSRQRWSRDVTFLLQDHEKNPHDARTVFYLAQTYDCLNDLDNACIWYEHRTKMTGWDEENFLAHYRLAQVYEAMNEWDKALNYYLSAYSMRPTRAEPLIRLAEHYWKSGEHDLAFLFSQRACQIPYPTQDLLCVEKHAYNFTRHDLLGINAWYITATNEHKLGKEGVLEALKAWPDAPHLQRNLKLYEDYNNQIEN